jgi:hypothetical protein
MPCVLSNSKIPKPSCFESSSQRIHLIGGAGGNESSCKQLDGFEQYLSGDDFALGSTPGEKGATQKRNGSARTLHIERCAA